MGILGNLSWRTWLASMTWIFSEEHKPGLQRIWWVWKPSSCGPLVKGMWACQEKRSAISWLGIKHTLLLESLSPSPSPPASRWSTPFIFKMNYPSSLLFPFPVGFSLSLSPSGRTSPGTWRHWGIDNRCPSIRWLGNLQFWEPAD